MTHLQQSETNATFTRLPELAADMQELQAEEAAQVNGGIIAVLIGLKTPQTPNVASSFVGGGVPTVHP